MPVKSKSALLPRLALACLVCMISLDFARWATADIRPVWFVPLHAQRMHHTGGCPEQRVDSEAACAMLCFLQPWCRVYVVGPCDQGGPAPCRCVVCQMDPVVDISVVEQRSSGRIAMPKRLVDGCDKEVTWHSVNSSCKTPIYNIQSSLGAQPILALRLHGVTFEDGSVRVAASPVCPPNFSPRGAVHCYTNEGVWHNQASLACYPLLCYQTHEGTRLYAGSLSVTVGGKPCWAWQDDGVVVNKYKDKPFMYDSYSNAKAKNYCRSFPAQRDDLIWCYNANFDPEGDMIEWQPCDVPACDTVY
ncbi:hypothetical protein EGW08_000553 [Elysia chlorotica]|uniref:Kringle domain-containing protein n=1 Tax=Elysia chlorotica TaxID=188477 RepID=A0A3S1A151_ELYCH|nr:hypothetical protein EGW08_000553 [Elysia chlorotica]